MAKPTAGALLELDLSSATKTALHRQLYLAVKRAILEGRLQVGTRLPSTRILAQDMQVSRTTVLNAFDQLAAEGYLKGKVGSGTWVASSVPGDLRQLETGSFALRGKPHVSRRAQVDAIASDFSFLAQSARPLRPGQPDLNLFPLELWSRLAAKHWRRATRDPEHIDSLGYRPLRRALCALVGRMRGVKCQPEQVLIVAGAQQALYLCAHTLLDPGESVWMEDPGYPRARAAFLAAGLRVVPVPVDLQGLVVSAGKKKEPFPRLIYVTPSFQCPLGCMMSLRRRFELLRVADEADAWIIEDDYFSEYRFGSGPAASLQSIDRAQRVIYIGNFSKSIAPSLRIGYLVLPPALVGTFARVRTTLSRQPPGVDQAILTEFISEGHLERHIRTTQGIYREREQALVEAISEYGEGILETNPTGTGMYLIAWLNPGVDDRTAAQDAATHGVDVIPLSTFSVKPLHRNGLVLGYSAYGGNRIRSAVKELCAALHGTRDLSGKLTRGSGRSHPQNDTFRQRPAKSLPMFESA